MCTELCFARAEETVAMATAAAVVTLATVTAFAAPTVEAPAASSVEITAHLAACLQLENGGLISIKIIIHVPRAFYGFTYMYMYMCRGIYASGNTARL